MIRLIITMILGYALGCVQWGFILGKLNGIDIRDYGSGNSGATNILRVLGKKASLITFLGDALKGVIIVTVARFLVCPHIAMNPQAVMMLAGLSAVLGHDFPVHMGFKGGKGVSTTGGVMFAINPLLTMIMLAIFIITVAITRYVSLGSCLLMVSIPILSVIFYSFNLPMVIMGCILGGLSIWRHRANIGRLLNGTESKIGEKVER
ncbi:MAG: glycerol-3-phosphate 1-O-acyltransferase PlsY [Lachnospiraceae bacterium]|nr:glycerol-3-phosphate 1-O-acyltransferase PlsY [Lachnospiraceae bacterium]